LGHLSQCFPFYGNVQPITIYVDEHRKRYPPWHELRSTAAFIVSPTAACMVTMARKGCHVFRILADLATVLFLIRCNTATSGVCALLCSGHTSTSLTSSCRFYKKQDSIVVVTPNAGDGVSRVTTFSPPIATSRPGSSRGFADVADVRFQTGAGYLKHAYTAFRRRA
jgi:hypothetical protein